MHGVVVLEGGAARFGREEEVAVLDEVDLGHLAVHGEESVQRLEELDPELADLDVQRRAELHPDACRGQRRRRGAEGRVALDDEDAAVEVRPPCQEGRDRGADDGATHDNDVGALHVAHVSRMLAT